MHCAGLTPWPAAHDSISWQSPYNYKENGGRIGVAWKSKDPDGILLTRHQQGKPRLLSPPGFIPARRESTDGKPSIGYHTESEFWEGMVHGASQSPTRGTHSPPRSPNYSRF